MATVKEMMLDMMDAAASVDTAAMMSAGDTFEGTINDTAGDAEDWISIKMEAGTTYTISVSGTLAASGGGTEQGTMDTILKLLDSKGGMIAMNDDDGPGMDSVSPGSKLEFTPEVSDTYYISVSTYQNNPNLDNSGSYTLSVTGMVVDPVTGDTKTGTNRVPDDTTTADTNEYVSGNDKLKGSAVDDKLNGGSGDDTLYGMAGDDTLDGGADDDLLVGGPGADTLKGGAGDDTIDYTYSPLGVTINLGDGTARGGDADGDTIVSMGTDQVENVRGSMYDDMLTGSNAVNKLWGLGGNDELDGGRRNDMLYGGAGDDDLDGGAGNDTLEGGYGADMLTGGAGSDTASYSMSMMGVTVRLHSGQAMNGDAEGDTWNLSETVDYTDNDEEMAKATVADIENLTGSGHGDILAGDLRDNTIMGGGGDDKIYGGPNPADADDDDEDSDPGLTNADMLHGGPGNDMIFGGWGNDVLKGDAGDDILNGGAGNDALYGGAGSDMIYADADDTVINGWLQTPPADDASTTPDESTEAVGDPMAIDTVSYAKLEEGVTRALTGAETGGATITNVENIIGSQGVDTLTGSTVNNVIEGGESGDTLDGGEGEDTLSYEHSDDWVRITLAAVGTAATASRGHASGDTATNFENVRGSAHDDDLSGGADTVVLNSKLWGMAGDDDMDGGGGNDMLEGGAGADELDGGYSDGGTSGAPNTQVNTVSYEESDAGVTVNLATASATGGHATGDTIVTYEELAPTDEDANNEIDVATFANVTGSKHNDRLTGNQHDNELTGGAGDDTLRGGASQRGDGSSAVIIRGDVLVGGPGADLLDGGEDMGEKDDMVHVDANDNGVVDDGEMQPASVDWAVYKHAMEGVTVDLSTNRGTGGEAMGDTLVNIELVWGSEKDDTFISGPGGNNIEGDGGSDTVSYEASSLGVTVDLSEATQHRTVAVTGAGTDASPFVFGPDSDPAAVARPTTGVPAILRDTTAAEHEDDNPNTNGARGDRLGSIENLTGSSHKDSLTGDANPNVLKGMGGDDTLNGGDETAGGDTLEGGMGDDTLNGGGGADKLNGGAGDDTLNGGADDDTLDGGAGDDDLTGGAGANTFVFSPEDGTGSDIIMDWATGTNNRIDLSAFELTEEQAIAAISQRGAQIIINLEAHGGGRITIDDLADIDSLDDATDDTATPADETTDDIIQELSIYDEADNADGAFIL